MCRDPLFESSVMPCTPMHTRYGGYVPTLIKNTKLCLTTGTLIWTITFLCTLPNNANSIRRLATNNVLYQLLPPAMLTLAGAIKLTLDFAKRHVVAACSYIRRCALKN